MGFVKFRMHKYGWFISGIIFTLSVLHIQEMKKPSLQIFDYAIPIITFIFVVLVFHERNQQKRQKESNSQFPPHC